MMAMRRDLARRWSAAGYLQQRGRRAALLAQWGGRPTCALARTQMQRAGLLSRWCSTKVGTNAGFVAPHVLDRVVAHAQNIALFEDTAQAQRKGESASMAGKPTTWTYAQLLQQALELRERIRDSPAIRRGGMDQDVPPRIALMGSRGAAYIAMQWAIWLAGGMAVPLHPQYPAGELQYILDDSDAALVLVSDEYADSPRLRTFFEDVKSARKTDVVVLPRFQQDSAATKPWSEQEEEDIRAWTSRCAPQTGALIVYTSGTTGRPKGVITTHAALTAQIHDVVTAWQMTASDHLLHFLPLHHAHGIVNNLLCVLYAGGSVEFLPSAAATTIWTKLAASASHRRVSMLMAVPTTYMNLLEDMNAQRNLLDEGKSPAYHIDQAVSAAKNLRVAISGSMACPLSILQRWERLTNHALLERYGMTELGMVLTNPLHGQRHFGFVGGPFPGVKVRLVDPETESELPLESEREGELRVRGPNVFHEYWRRQDATTQAFDADGWFKTGDIAQYKQAESSFRIRGRASADILKIGGYKVSALDIERVLLQHPKVPECAVIGMPDERWGQVIAAVIRTNSRADDHTPEDEAELAAFVESHMPKHCVPRRFFFVEAIPKNAMGKINKRALAAQLLETSN